MFLGTLSIGDCEDEDESADYEQDYCRKNIKNKIEFGGKGLPLDQIVQEDDS